MPNKYQEEAALLAGDLGGTKWEKSVGPISARRPARASFAIYAEENRSPPLAMQQGAAFIFGGAVGHS